MVTKVALATASPVGGTSRFPGRLVHDARGDLISQVESVDLFQPSIQLAIEWLGDAPGLALSAFVPDFADCITTTAKQRKEGAEGRVE